MCLKFGLVSPVAAKWPGKCPHLFWIQSPGRKVKLHWLFSSESTFFPRCPQTRFFHLLVYTWPKVCLVIKPQPICSGIYSTEKPAKAKGEEACWIREGRGWKSIQIDPASPELPPCFPVRTRVETDLGVSGRGDLNSCRGCGVGACWGGRGLGLFCWKVLASPFCCKSNFTIKADIVIFIFFICVCFSVGSEIGKETRTILRGH